MPKNSPIPVPNSGAALQWLMENPEAVKTAVQYLNLLLGLQVRPTKAGLATFNQQTSLLISGEVIQLPLPIFWAAGVPTAVATYSDTAGVGYSQSDTQALMDQVTALTTALNLILAGERSVQNIG